MRLGFYLAGDSSAEVVVPPLARAAKRGGERLLVVAGENAQLDSLDRALWERCAEEFLAHGRAGQGHEERQPLLLSRSCEAPNGARIALLADGRWREEAETFDRALLVFENTGRQAARETWRRFDGREDVTREFYEFVAGQWVKKA